MPGILADVNILGHMDVLIRVLEGPYWGEVWADLKVPLRTFADIGLTPEDSDAAVWHACQRHQVCLFTDNRNMDGDDSLEAVLRTANTASSLPVFTVGNAERLRNNSDYLKQVAERLLECLIDIENYKGVGRVFLP